MTDWIRAEKRLAIYLRDGFVCTYCGVDLHGSDPNLLTLDHLETRNWRGRALREGENSEANLVTACKSCNSTRHDKALEDWCTPEQLARVEDNVNRDLDPYYTLACTLARGEEPAEDLDGLTVEEATAMVKQSWFAQATNGKNYQATAAWLSEHKPQVEYERRPLLLSAEEMAERMRRLGDGQ